MTNGWLDPTVLGVFNETAVHEIRTSLTLEDMPMGLPGAQLPTPADLLVIQREYAITAGDSLSIEIYELRRRQEVFVANPASVTPTGYVNLPVVGRVPAEGLTVPEFQEALITALKDRGILVDPEVTVNPGFLYKASYSIFGIGVSAANNAPLRAGLFPIRRPDLHVLEAINQVGGLNEFVTDVYIFRRDEWLDGGIGEPVDSESLGGADGVEGSETHERVADDQPAATEAAAEQALRDLVLVEAEPAEQEAAEQDQDVDLLQPDPAQPYLFVDGEFVQNPTYQGEDDRDVPSSSPLPLDTATPAVNWARLAGDSSFRLIRIPAEQLRAGNPELDIIVRAGDTIRIVSGEIGAYYVMGQVNRVGAFGFNAEPVTLKAAIASAGGLSALAWPDRCTVYRRIGQREQMIQVDLDRVFAGQDPDFFIKRGDIINVGTHPFAPFLQRIRALTLPNPASNVGYSFTYARNFADIDSFGARANPHNEPDRFPNLFP